MDRLESVDWFTDPNVHQQPYPYCEYLRSKGSAVYLPQHNVVAVTDYNEALKFLGFYRDLLGLPLRSDGMIEPGGANYEAFATIVGLPNSRVRGAQLGAGNIVIEVFEFHNPKPRGGEALRPCDIGIRHIAFDVTDIDAEYAQLKAAGVTIFSEPQSVGQFRLRSVYLRDPDNNIVELQEIFPGSGIDRSHVRSWLPGLDSNSAEARAFP